MDSCAPNNISDTKFTDACFYVKNYSRCALESGFLNYYEWQYCAFNNRGVPSFLMFCWLLVLLLAIAITADSFFAPCLVVVTKVFRMSQNLAGVTLLALGNGAPDLFSSLSAVDSGNVGMAIGSIFGAGIMVNTITAGVIMIVCPFTVARRPVMKDLAFYLIGILWCLMIILRRKVELWSSLGLLSIYAVYVFVTALSRFLYVKYKKDNLPNKDQENGRQEITNQFDSVLNLSDADIQRVQAVTRGHINSSFVEIRENSPLVKSKFAKYSYDSSYTNLPSKPASRTRRSSADTLAFRSLGQNIVLNRITSTSHRNNGFLAKLIMANEMEMQALNKEKDALKEAEKQRCKSLTIPSRGRFKRSPFMSVLVEERSSPTEKSVEKSSSNRPNINDDPSRSSDNIINQSSTSINNDNSITTNSVAGFYAQFPGMFKHFLLTIVPIDIESWADQSKLEKIQTVIQSPIVFILTLTVPVVDDGAFLQGWCKLLNALHCIVSPMVWIIIFKGSMIKFGSTEFMLDYLILIIGLLLCIIVLITSKADRPPVYHCVYAFIGFLTSIVWIYEVANEIVNLLSVFGVVFTIPDIVLGLSVLAFANSIGDLVSNIVLAKRNFPAIGYAACIGGPLFNLLVGIGLPFSIRTARKGTIHMDLQSETIMLIVTAMLVTVMNLFALPLQRFRVRKVYGIILVSVYAIFIVLIILLGLGVIHAKL